MNINPDIYSSFIDSLLKKLRVRVGRQIVAQSNVIDIACGTGAQAFHLAEKCSSVTGVDIWDPMINYAKKKKLKLNIQNLTFRVADATNLIQFKDKEFDFSIMSLALHQFLPDDRLIILKEATRISKTMIIADYATPQPKNIYGFGIRIAERLAGKEHFTNFKNYLLAGGLYGIAKESDLKIRYMEDFGKGIFVLGIL